MGFIKTTFLRLPECCQVVQHKYEDVYILQIIRVLIAEYTYWNILLLFKNQFFERKNPSYPGGVIDLKAPSIGTTFVNSSCMLWQYIACIYICYVYFTWFQKRRNTGNSYKRNPIWTPCIQLIVCVLGSVYYIYYIIIRIYVRKHSTVSPISVVIIVLTKINLQN